MLNPNAIQNGSITQEMIDVSVLDAKQDVIDDLYTIREGAKIGNEAFDIITSMVNAGYLFAGIATPITDPSEPNAKVFYIANGKGTYEKFGGINVTEDEVVVLYYDTAWHKVATGIASQEKLSELGQQVIYDVTTNNDGATFASLSALLSDENLSTLIPSAVRRGGMSIQFIRSSDNKYVQYRLMTDVWSTIDTNWQGVDDMLIYQSSNMITSGAVGDAVLDIKDAIGKEETFTYDRKQYANMFLIVADGYPRQSTSGYNGIIIPISVGEKYIVNTVAYSMATFSSYPIIGSNLNVVRTDLSAKVLFTAGESEKYLLVSLNLSISPVVSITRKETGIIKKLNTANTDIRTLYDNSFPIINSDYPSFSRYIIDAYIANYDNNYLYYIDLLFWKHSEYGTRIRIQKENKSDHTTSVLAYDTNVAVNNDDVQILNVKSGSNTVAKLVVNTKYLVNGMFLSNVRIEFSDNVGVNNGLYLGYEGNRELLNSAYSTALQSLDLAQSAINSNAKTNDSALLRKSINLFDGEFINSVCDSTTGILTNSSGYKTTKNSIPVSNGQTLFFTYTNSKGKREYIGGFLQEYSDVEGTIPILRDTRLSENIYKCTDENVKSIRIGFRTDNLDVAVDAMEYMIYVDNVYANIYKQQASSTYPQYVPIGYLNELDPSKNTLLGSLTGKKVICFGDSITAYGFYPQYAGLICGADIKNCGVGGTWLTHRVGNGYDLNTAWGKFSGDALADSIASGDFSAQVEAADYIYANAGINVRGVASELVSTDWNNVNIVTFAFCTNDYNNTSHVEGTVDSMDPLTYRGAVNYIVNKIQTVYPHIKIIFICPTYRVFPYGHGYNMTDEEYKNSSYLIPEFEDSDTWENSAGYTLKYIIKTVEDQTAINHCGCLNMYYNLGINKYTYLRYLADGTHLTYDGYREYGLRLAKFLMSAN